LADQKDTAHAANCAPLIFDTRFRLANRESLAELAQQGSRMGLLHKASLAPGGSSFASALAASNGAQAPVAAVATAAATVATAPHAGGGAAMPPGVLCSGGLLLWPS
jgi:hypothetical protein